MLAEARLRSVESIGISTMPERDSISMKSDPTPYTDMNALIEQLLSRIQEVLGEKLVGLYLYGSLVTGDFDHGSSDIDIHPLICSIQSVTYSFIPQNALLVPALTPHGQNTPA
jgi:hypothetical protein